MSDQNARQTYYPIGTLEEIIELGLDQNEVRCCAEPIKGQRMGCRFFGPKGGCLFPELYRPKGGPVGPENRGYYKMIHETGATQGFPNTPCYVIMETVAERMAQAKRIGESYSRFYVPGEQIKWRVSEKLHKKRNPDCTACMKNDCNKMEMITHLVTIDPFPRPKERFANTVWEGEVAGEIRDSVDWDQRMGALKLRDPQPEPEIDVDTSRGVAPATQLSDLITEGASNDPAAEAREAVPGRPSGVRKTPGGNAAAS